MIIPSDTAAQCLRIGEWRLSLSRAVKCVSARTDLNFFYTHLPNQSFLTCSCHNHDDPTFLVILPLSNR